MYPSGVDLQRYLTGAGLLASPLTFAQSIIDYDAAMSAASAEFERLTGYLPFLSDGISTLRVFDGPESSILQLRAGLLSLTSLTINTTAYTENVQFVLQPTDGPSRKLPYTYVDFGSGWQSGGYGLGSDFAWGFGAGGSVGLGYVGGGRRSVSITGIWGYCSVLPADVRTALLQYGASIVVPELIHPVTGGVVEEREEDELKKFGKNVFQGQLEVWTARFEATVCRYKLFRL